MQLDGWSSGVKPWSKPAATDTIRDLIKLRMQLLPSSTRRLPIISAAAFHRSAT